MSPREGSSIQAPILRWLSSQPLTVYAINLHGEQFQERGLADIVACVRGQFCTIECKRPGEVPAKLQEYHGDKVQAAGGLHLVAHSVEEVQEWFAKNFMHET